VIVLRAEKRFLGYDPGNDVRGSRLSACLARLGDGALLFVVEKHARPVLRPDVGVLGRFAGVADIRLEDARDIAEVGLV
jgi:hypothetical protein